MNLLLTASTIFTLIALFFVFSMGRHIRRRRPVRATGSLAGGIASASLGGASVLLAFSYYGYGRLVDEQSVGKIEFTQSEPGEYVARLMIQGETDRFLTLRGDEWQMDAKIVTWKPPVTILGLDPIFQLDRLSGRYSEIDQELSHARTVHSLSPAIPVDIWRAARRFPLLTPGVDAFYGTATYLPMADGARFEVSLTRDALIARPANIRARDAVGGWDSN